MNKQERIIAILLGVVLAGWVFYSSKQNVKQAKEAALHPPATAAGAAATNRLTQTVLAAPVSTADMPVVEEAAPAVPSVPEELVTLQGEEMTLVVSSYGAVLKQVTLSAFNAAPGKAGAKNPPVMLDFATAPALELAGVPGLAGNAVYRVARDATGQAVTLSTATAQGLAVSRRIELLKNYQVKVTDTLRNAGENVVTLGTNAVGMGVMRKGDSKNEMLSLDSLPALAEAKARHWGSEKATKQYLVGGTAGSGFGCGGAPSAAGMADQVTVPVLEAQAWVALKSRFFVTLFSSSETNCGFTARMARDISKPTYVLSHLSARVLFLGRVLGQGETLTRDYMLYIGPKKLSLLQAMNNRMDAVMEFGFFAWFCKLLVPTLNFFHRIIPNYGVAIILLTFLVRIIFWPLTHKSTVSMRKMQEIQPQLKELQKQFKDNPQKLQQETWALYRTNKVNPLSSCLPMLIQIPVFIALFTVLRSAVELRYAPFLWIGDLSEPENLLAGVLPLPLNILPFLMSGTMALQSYLTPSMGDPQQQKMMMVMMPIMMLFMFYSFPAALSLYWTVSQALSIVQMLMMRQKIAHKHDPDGGVTVESPMTRQQRRHAVK
ncbi:MAG: YidC/Oxa1 family insertase periplasmic-domain containing protein [bacterium]